MNFTNNRIVTTFCITGVTWLFTISIALAQPPTAGFSSDITSGCFPITVNFADLSTNSPTSWEWDFGNGNTSTFQNPSAVYPATGNYTVTLIACNGNGCDTIIQNPYINVFDYPIADLSANITFGCSPLTVQFTDLSNPISSPIVWWFWDFGDGFSSPAPNPSHTYLLPGIYDVSISITDSLGCNDSKSITDYVLVSTPPILSYTPSPSTSCVAPLTVTFTNTSTLGTYPVTSWYWDFGDGFSDTGPNPTHNYTSSGSYTVSLTATDSIGCAVTRIDSNVIVVGNDPSYFTYSTVRTCTELQVSFFGTPNQNITNWSWDFGDGSPTQSGQNINHDYTTSGTFTVTLITTNVGGCTDTSSQNISYQLTTGSFVADTTYGCTLPFNVSYSGAATGNAPFSWAWDFSYVPSAGFMNESTLQNPSYAYTYQDTFDVMMIVTDVFGCTDAVTLMGSGDSIWVLLPDAAFDESPWEGCVPLTVSFTDISDAGMGSIASWAWNFDDTISGVNNTSSLQNPSHTFDSVGIFNIILTITNTLGCTDSWVSIVRTGYPPLADSITVSQDTACHGEPVMLTGFSADTNVNGGWWNFGDGTPIGNGWPTVSHGFQDTGLLIIQLIPIYNGCPGDTPIYDSIYILPPKPIFTASPTFSCTSPLTVTFTNTSWDADSSSWDFGDGSPLSTTVNPVHTYTTPGRYTVQLTVTNDSTGCTDSENLRYIDIPQPTANFSASPTVGCVPHTVTFTDASFNYISAWSYRIVSWSWDFGDATFSSLRSPTHTYSSTGVFTVTLTITDAVGCTNTLIKTDLIVTSTSAAGFTASPTVGCEGLTVSFTDQSTQYSPIVSWSWDFGDGSPANSTPSPTHTYTASGTYNVQLTITDSIGCVNTMTKSSYIFITKPNPQFTHASRVCLNESVDFVNTTSGSGLSFFWDFGDGFTTTIQNPSHSYSDTGLYIITLVATDSNGCPDTGTSQLESVGPPVVDFSVDSFFAICPPLIVQFNDLSTDFQDTIVSWYWDFGDSNSTTAQNPVHTFVDIGSYDVQLTVTNSVGCVDSIIKLNMITVAGPTGDFSFSPDTGCVPMTVTFTSITSNTDVYHWDFGNGIVDTVSGGTITHTYMQPGFPIPQLSLTDSIGCKLPATAPIPPYLTIGEVIAGFSLFPTILYTPFCPADTIFFSDSSYTLNDSSLITGWLWDFDDATFSTAQHPAHVYTGPGTYTISLTAYSSLGCSDTASKTVDIILNDTLVLRAIIIDSVPTSCYSGSDGKATADGLSGTAAYTFLWGASAGNQTTAIATGLLAGTHSVLVSDANGCIDSTTVIITEPDSLYFLVDSMSGVSCNGFSDGSIAVSGTGGITPYSYLWDAAAGNQTTALATGLIAGVYTLSITDSNGCIFTDTAAVTEPTVMIISIDTTDVVCNGDNDGTATANPTGGTPGYSFLWGASAGNQPTATATGLAPGTHTVTVTDSNGCVDSAIVLINEPAVLSVITDSISDVTCNGFSDGSITVSGTGGIAPFSYLWDAAAANQTTANATGLIAGVYTITVTDTNGCIATNTDTVTEPTAIVISITTTDALCYGDSNGTATANPTGGWAPYSYLWGASAGNQTTATATGLVAGTHAVIVTDSTGCSDSTIASINEPAVLIGNTDSISNVSCYGFSDGSISVSATGGTVPYSYLWDAAAGNQTTSTAIGLVIGVYTYTVTDSNGCTFTDSATITEPAAIIISIDSTDVLCNAGNDGTATASPTGGTSPYSYLWGASAGSQTTDIATDLLAGTYSVTVTDANNCIADTQVTVLEPPLLTVNIIELNSTLCFGESDGELDVLVSGGVLPYSYLWLPGNLNDPSIDSLAAGSYIITINDSNNCQASDTAGIVELTPLELDMDDDTVCYNVIHAIDAQPSGSAPPYTFLWTDGINNMTGNPIFTVPDTTESWSVTVTDSVGCTISDSVTLFVNYIEVSLSFPDTVCYEDMVTIDAEATGTLPGFNSSYTYLWNTSQSTSSIQAQVFSNTTFIVTVTDGCSKSASDSAFVNIFTFPDIGIKTSSPACPFTPIIFSDTINSIAGATHEWDFGDGNTATGVIVQHAYNSGGTYYPSVTVTTPIGCSRTYTAPLPVIIYATPNAWFEPNTWAAPYNNPLIYFTNASWITPIAGDIIESYFWEFGDGDTDTLINPTHTFPNFGYYSVTLTATSQYGCEGQVTRDIRILEPDIDLLIPTAFTPDPSGSSGGWYDPASFDNDVFYPITDYVEEYLLQIYNRWGELVFVSTDLAIGWDGYYRDKLSQQATYIWKMKIIWITGKEYENVGRILLIR